MSPASLREDCLSAQQLHSRLAGRLRLAVPAHPHVAGGDSPHGTVVGVEHFRRGEAGENHHLQLFRLLGEPAAEVAEADDVVAPVVHLGRRRHADRAPCAKEQESVVGSRRVEGCAALLPVREQFVERARFDNCAGEDMSTDLRALLDQAHRELPAVLDSKLSKPDCRTQTGGSAADDDDIEFHRLSFHPVHPPDAAGAIEPGTDLCPTAPPWQAAEGPQTGPFHAGRSSTSAAHDRD